jgi:S-adenosylmethionine:tRNA ribosyltransferase-isomerase
LKIADFDFDLPPELIAQDPLPERDASRMMVVFRREGRFAHASFRDLPDYLAAGDLLVLNDTKVIPAKTWGRRGDASIEFLFIKERTLGEWEVICRPAKRLRIGDRVVFAADFEAVMIETGDEGRRVLRFEAPDVLARLSKIGYAPLPHYIKRKKLDAARRPADLARYQTVFAAHAGAIAAPTAGLHFTPAMLERLGEAGVEEVRVTLNVGPATFQPVRVENLEDHRMGEESYEISPEAAAAINGAKCARRPVLAVGTTVVRTLESAARVSRAEGQIPGNSPSSIGRIPSVHPFSKGEGVETGIVRPGKGSTSLFIYPGFEFRVVDRLLTNFHLPQSTLLALISAFADRDLVLDAYQEAIRERYRFFSYGDCMLIL